MNKCLVRIAITILLCGLTGMPALDNANQTKLEPVPPTQEIKVKTELMEVRAVVTDQKGRIVDNLKKEDFELLENDKAQEISFFSVSQVEGDLSAPPAAKVNTPEKPSERPRTRERLSEPPVRTTLLYVDNLHLSFSSLNRVKQAIRDFVKERLTDQDMVALATSGQTLGPAQQFTRDRQLLNYGIEQINFAPGRLENLYSTTLAAGIIAEQPDAMRLGVDMARIEYNINCPCETLRRLAKVKALQTLAEASFARKSMLSTLRDIAEQMIRLPGKRMIVIFSDGFTAYDNDGGVHYEQLQPAIDRAVRSGVVIYTIDAKGLQIPPTFDASKRFNANDPDRYPWVSPEDRPPETEPNKGCPEDDPRNPDARCFAPDTGLWTSFMNTSEREEQNGLSAVADGTGGKMYTNTNNLGDALGRALEANRFYYVLSYYLQAGSDDRNFRSIRVRVRNHPEYTVLAPKRFSPMDVTAKPEYEMAKTPQQRLIRAMNSPLPLTDLGVSAQADFIENETDDKQVSLTVYFDGDRFQYREQDQRNVFELEILYFVYDYSGKQVEGMSAQVEGNLTKNRLAQAKNSGYRFSRRLTLKPGRYQARIGVRQEGTDLLGTAATWVEVPALAREKLEMSSLILRNPLLDMDPAAEGINISELEQVKVVQGIPLYARGDFCDYSFRVYRGTKAPKNSDLVIMKELFQGGKSVKQEPWKPIPAEEMEVDNKGWFDLDGEVDLNGLAPSVYELRVTVKDTRSSKIVQRTAVFGVE
jgi:VWFA-related protein